MKPAAITKPFARRMIPLACLVAFLSAVGFPAVHQHLATSELEGAAKVWAENLSNRIANFAESRPRLWPYDTGRLSDIVRPALRPPISAGIRIDIPGQNNILAVGPPRRTESVPAWALIQVNGRVVGRLQVRLDGTGLYAATKRVWLGSVVVGLLLGLLLFTLPVRVIAQAERDQQELWEALSRANETLEARVEERTSQLRNRESQLQDLGARLVSVQEEERDPNS